jgi:hypothetical protein
MTDDEARSEIQRLVTARRDLKRAMREQGIRRRSFMNGGLSDREYRCNADMFSIETRIKSLQRQLGIEP